MHIVDGREYIPEVRELIKEYTDSLGRDLTFQALEDELRDPAKKYTPPNGELIVAIDGKKVLGMVAYHRHSDKRCELKRLYIRHEARGLGLGCALMDEILGRAKAAGFSEIVLDTLAPMQAAIGLYRKYGFAECEPYYGNPLPDVLYFKKAI